ncbi:MAG: hypothetical protein NTW87_03815 [Planctomycetota bacterium]|nr:hypothetical protein [Planctomycetota bacterium]
MLTVVPAGADCCHAADGSLRIEVLAGPGEVAMGRAVTLDVSVRDDKGTPAANCLLLTYVNERRWGAHEVTDGQGKARRSGGIL